MVREKPAMCDVKFPSLLEIVPGSKHPDSLSTK
jgi:hypothetical protein